uniref:Transposase Tnp1/En/Spm-like domain-containing protein n=1 Tax=Oryza brachyantha TaxID=4533 RepID=J3KVH3_ORYBR
MVRLPRRLRKLSLDEHVLGDEQVNKQNLHFNKDLNLHLEDDDGVNIQVEENDLEDYSESDNLLTELPNLSRRPINIISKMFLSIIGTDGVVRQVLGEFKKEKSKGKVHSIDVWDEAHKKKDPRLKAALEMVYNELAKRKDTKSGNLSTKDYEEVFRGIVGKETKLQGYYDNNNNWSQENIDEQVNSTKSCDNVEQQLHSFSYAKATDGHVNLSVPQGHMIAKVHSFEQANDGSTNGFANNLANPDANLHSTSNYVQQSCNICCTNAKDHHENLSVLYERTFAKGHIQQTNNDIIDTFVSELEDLSSSAHAIPNNMQLQQASVASSGKRPRSSESYVEPILSHKDKVNQVPQRKEVLKQSSSKLDQRVVYIFSLNPVYKNRVVAKGNLVTMDSTHVVGGDMVGSEYYGVAIHAVSNIANERLPRPFENCHTVKKLKANTSTCVEKGVDYEKNRSKGVPFQK